MVGHYRYGVGGLCIQVSVRIFWPAIIEKTSQLSCSASPASLPTIGRKHIVLDLKLEVEVYRKF